MHPTSEHLQKKNGLSIELTLNLNESGEGIVELGCIITATFEGDEWIQKHTLSALNVKTLNIILTIVYREERSVVENHNVVSLTYLHLNKSSFVWESPGQHPWVTEAGPQQHGYDEEEDDDCEYGDGRGQVDSQVRTSAGVEMKDLS